MPDPPGRAPGGLRLRGSQKTEGAAYFLTIATDGGQLLFGRIADVAAQHTPAGEMIMRVWRGMPSLSRGLLLDDFIVMPNHIHAIFGFAVPEPKPNGELPIPPPDHVRITRLVKNFRTETAKQYTEGVREAGWPRFTGKLWEPSERLRKLEALSALNECRDYITMNPARWHLDRLNPNKQQ